LLIEVSNVRVVVGQHTAADLQRLAVVRLGLGQAALRLQQFAHVVDRDQRVRVVVAQDLAPGLQRPLLVRHRLDKQSQLPVRARHRLPQRRLCPRLISEGRSDGVGGMGQDVLVQCLQREARGVHCPDGPIECRKQFRRLRRLEACLKQRGLRARTQVGNDRPAHCLGVHITQHRRLELDDLLKLIGLLVGVIPGFFRKLPLLGFAQGETYGHRCRRDQARGHECPCRHDRTVAADELVELVDGTRRARDDRLVSQVPPDVHDQAVGGLVSPGAILLHRLHHDPVQIASKLAKKRSRIRPAFLRGLRRFIAETAQPRAGLGRLLLADDSLDLGEPRAAEGRPIEWQHPGQ